MSAAVPVKRPARVTVTLTDGRSATQTRDSHRGDFTDPFSEAELRGKFRELAGVVLTTEGVTAVEQAVDRIDQWPNIGELTGLLRRHGKV
jgi:2-methylcitrate dehydratase PrpD